MYLYVPVCYLYVTRMLAIRFCMSCTLKVCIRFGSRYVTCNTGVIFKFTVLPRSTETPEGLYI